MPKCDKKMALLWLLCVQTLHFLDKEKHPPECPGGCSQSDSPYWLRSVRVGSTSLRQSGVSETSIISDPWLCVPGFSRGCSYRRGCRLYLNLLVCLWCSVMPLAISIYYRLLMIAIIAPIFFNVNDFIRVFSGCWRLN